MNENSSLLHAQMYSSQEQYMKKRLTTLFSVWKEELKQVNEEHKKKKETLPFDYECFSPDGFYPNYTSQPQKVLFIGREGLWLEGASYIESLYAGYKEDCIAGKAVNTYGFHRKMLKIAYGLIHNNCPWEDIPPASEIAKTIGEKKGISFAFMNLSKISNDTPKGKHNKSNWLQINGFLEATEKTKKYFQEEIRILDPDIIIAMFMTSLQYIKYLGEEKQAMEGDSYAPLWSITAKGKKYPLVTTYHFSSCKCEKEDFYEPIVYYIHQIENLLGSR